MHEPQPVVVAIGFEAHCCDDETAHIRLRDLRRSRRCVAGVGTENRVDLIEWATNSNSRVQFDGLL